jgi:hypothetical protein
MGPTKVVVRVGIGLSVLLAAGVYVSWRRSERFHVEITRPGTAYTTAAECESGRGTETAAIPVGERLEVTSIDWAGKSYPCFESKYQGRRVYLTSDLFRVLDR